MYPHRKIVHAISPMNIPCRAYAQTPKAASLASAPLAKNRNTNKAPEGKEWNDRDDFL
jgi:hypothetical protein